MSQGRQKIRWEKTTAVTAFVNVTAVSHVLDDVIQRLLRFFLATREFYRLQALFIGGLVSLLILCETSKSLILLPALRPFLHSAPSSPWDSILASAALYSLLSAFLLWGLEGRWRRFRVIAARALTVATARQAYLELRMEACSMSGFPLYRGRRKRGGVCTYFGSLQLFSSICLTPGSIVHKRHGNGCQFPKTVSGCAVTPLHHGDIRCDCPRCCVCWTVSRLVEGCSIMTVPSEYDSNRQLHIVYSYVEVFQLMLNWSFLVYRCNLCLLK